jgi:hypothetical protein
MIPRDQLVLNFMMALTGNTNIFHGSDDANNIVLLAESLTDAFIGTLPQQESENDNPV